MRDTMPLRFSSLGFAVTDNAGLFLPKRIGSLLDGSSALRGLIVSQDVLSNVFLALVIAT